MTGTDEAQQGIRELAARLQTLQDRLGPAYWTDPEVHELQAELKVRLGISAGHEPDGPPAHARARRQARLEAEVARLLWPW